MSRLGPRIQPGRMASNVKNFTIPRASQPVSFTFMRPRLNGWTVLIAEDDDVLRESLAGLLRSEGYVVDTASDGLKAMFAAIRMRPSVVVLDPGMPKLDGWSFVHQLRASGLIVPLVVMSGVENPRQVAQHIGAEAWLRKPFQLEEILPAIQRACAWYALSA